MEVMIEHEALRRLAGRTTAMRAHLRDPIWWTDALQIVKTVAAAVIAWVLAVYVFDIQQAFLAPWAALLTVHATVYRTFRRGAQQVGATVLGVLVAFVFGSLFGLTALSLGLAILVGLVAGSVRGLRAETTTAAATALVVLTTGISEEPGALLSRLADTGIGIAVGLLVNLLVWPPLRERTAAAQVGVIDDRLGELLADMATALRDRPPEEEIDGWIARTSELESDIDGAWASCARRARAAGSTRAGRRAAACRRPRTSTPSSSGSSRRAPRRAAWRARSGSRASRPTAGTRASASRGSRCSSAPARP
jgi:uncharacterized membrane protein YccC